MFLILWSQNAIFFMSVNLTSEVGIRTGLGIRSTARRTPTAEREFGLLHSVFARSDEQTLITGVSADDHRLLAR